MTAGNTCGTSAAQSLAVTVVATPATPGAITGTAAQCAAAAGQTYSITPVTYATTYTWTVPTGWTITAGAGTASITVTAGAAGQNGNITVTAGNTCGTSAAQSLAVTVIPLPAQPGDFTTSTTLVCQGQNNVTYTVPDDPTVTYSWSYSGTGASITGTGNSVTVSYSTTATSGTLSVTATNSCGTSAARTLVITVNAVPTAPTVAVTQPTCAVATGTITVTSTTTGLTFSLDGAPSVAYPAGGFTTVASGPHTLTAQNAGGCISSVTNTTVDAQPATPAAPTVAVTQPTCAVATGTIAVTSTTAGLTFSLDGAPSVAYPAGGFTTVASGPHTLTAQNASGCISSVTNTTVDATASDTIGYRSDNWHSYPEQHLPLLPSVFLSELPIPGPHLLLQAV